MTTQHLFPQMSANSPPRALCVRCSPHVMASAMAGSPRPSFAMLSPQHHSSRADARGRALGEGHCGAAHQIALVVVHPHPQLGMAQRSDVQLRTGHGDRPKDNLRPRGAWGGHRRGFAATHRHGHLLTKGCRMHEALAVTPEDSPGRWRRNGMIDG